MKRAVAILLATAIAVAVDASGSDSDVAQTVATVTPSEAPSSSSRSDCPDACFEIYDPVCGTDGVTYSNSCFLLIAQCKNPNSGLVKASDSECATEAKPSPTPEITVEASGSEADDCANRMCPMVYSPVCGSDGKTYSNSCMLGLAQCKNPALVATGDGECESTAARASSSSGDVDDSVGNDAGSNNTVSSDGRSGCHDACPMMYDPVCGSDGKTYSNACSLQVASCNNPELNLTQVGKGECADAATLDDSTMSVGQTAM